MDSQMGIRVKHKFTSNLKISALHLIMRKIRLLLNLGKKEFMLSHNLTVFPM
jgi:hypothetical protein